MSFPPGVPLHCTVFVQIQESSSHAGKKTQTQNTLSAYLSSRVRMIDIQKERERKREKLQRREREREGIGISLVTRHTD